MDALSRLISKARPFKPFTYKDDPYFVRRTSVADNEEINAAYTAAYDGEIDRLIGDDDAIKLRRQIGRQSKEKLAEFITASEKASFIQEAADLLPIEPEASEEDRKAIEEKRAAEVESMLKSNQEQLLALELEELRQMALDRREHFSALFAANTARMRAIAKLTLYVPQDDGEPVRLFQSDADVRSLPEDDLDGLLAAAAEAIKGDAEADPLK